MGGLTPPAAGSGTTQHPVPLLVGWAQHTLIHPGAWNRCSSTFGLTLWIVLPTPPHSRLRSPRAYLSKTQRPPRPRSGRPPRPPSSAPRGSCNHRHRCHHSRAYRICCQNVRVRRARLRTPRPLAVPARRLSFRQRSGSCGIIGSTMWKRLLAGIFGLVGLVVWRRFLGETEDQSVAQDTLAGTLQKTWTKSGSMSGREFEHFMADLFRAAGYKVDVVGSAGDQGVDLLLKEGRKRIAVQCKKYGRPVGTQRSRPSMPEPSTMEPNRPG